MVARHQQSAAPTPDIATCRKLYLNLSTETALGDETWPCRSLRIQLGPENALYVCSRRTP